MPRFCLDTSALLTLRDDEPGADRVAELIDATEPLLLSAAQTKAGHRLSLADAWIAASALECGATLVHKDPEFLPIAGLDQAAR